jgi:hypothetical protein
VTRSTLAAGTLLLPRRLLRVQFKYLSNTSERQQRIVGTVWVWVRAISGGEASSGCLSVRWRLNRGNRSDKPRPSNLTVEKISRRRKHVVVVCKQCRPGVE